VKLALYPDRYAVCRLDGDAPTPPWFSLNAPFAGVIRRGDELSIVAPQDTVPAGTPDVERDWAALELEGPMDFGLTGVLASVAQPLADDGIPIFALATYDTDVVLIPGARLDDAVDALTRAGHEIDG
jgi:hypothetical protein